MGQTVCKGCGGVIDFAGVEPFVLCECSDCGTEIVIPYEFGFFKFEKKLKPIACFDVYEGFDMSNNMDSIVYVFNKELAGDEWNQILEIAKEVTISVETLKHANICPIVNSGEVEGLFYVCEPKMDGFPLSDYIPNEQSELEISKVVDVLQSTAVGLAVVHHKELLHHNICPKNIHIDARGNIRLKNVFISLFRSKFDEFKNIDSTVSKYFISPEKALDGKEDKSGDVFSFGVMAYLLFTGKCPFDGATDIETIYSRVNRKKVNSDTVFSSTAHRMITKETVEFVQPVLISKLRAELDTKVGNLIMRMLDSQPLNRPILPKVLDVIAMYQAQICQQDEVVAAQKTMVTTVTRAIPKMTPVSGVHKRPKKRRFFN